MIFDIPFMADWNKIGDYRQSLMDRNNDHEIKHSIDYDNKVRDKVLISKDGILCKSESKYGKAPWTIVTVHTNGMIRVQCKTKSEQINIQKVISFIDKIVLE